MDLQAYKLVGGQSSRWAKVLAFLCFALACGLLIGSLLKAHAAHAARTSSPSVVLDQTGK